MSRGTGLPVGSVVLVKDVNGPTAYQRKVTGNWVSSYTVISDSQMLAEINLSEAEVVYRAYDKDEALAQYLWEVFEKDPWEETSNITRGLQKDLAKRTRAYVLQQEEGAL